MWCIAFNKLWLIDLFKLCSITTTISFLMYCFQQAKIDWSIQIMQRRIKLSYNRVVYFVFLFCSTIQHWITNLFRMQFSLEGESVPCGLIYPGTAIFLSIWWTIGMIQRIKKSAVKKYFHTFETQWWLLSYQHGSDKNFFRVSGTKRMKKILFLKWKMPLHRSSKSN